MRRLRCAGLAGLGDSRVVPGFRCSFLPCMPSSMTPGSSAVAFVQYGDHRRGPSPRSERLGTPAIPQSTSRGARISGLPGLHLLRPVRLLAPLDGSDLVSRPPGAFTSRLPTGRSPSPLLDITTTATGLLCRWDSHPLEWQLASLHRIRTCALTHPARQVTEFAA
jgi:hypothetical protein